MGSGGITAPARLAAAHELSDFTNGRHPSLDNWLRERVLVSEGVSARTYVVCDKERPQSVVGYYAISTAMEQRAVLPSAGLRRGQPDQVPLLLIGRLAVDASFQETELGAALLADAMRRCLAAAEIAGVRAVAAQAIDDEAVGFYEHHGFLRSPLGDRVMLLPLEAARTLMPA